MSLGIFSFLLHGATGRVFFASACEKFPTPADGKIYFMTCLLYPRLSSVFFLPERENQQ
jgi:hypothetical protein